MINKEFLLWRFSVTAVWSLTQGCTNSVSLVFSCSYRVPDSLQLPALTSLSPSIEDAALVKVRPSVYPSSNLSLSLHSLSCSYPPFPMRSFRPPGELVWLLRAVPVLLETPLQYSY